MDSRAKYEQNRGIEWLRLKNKNRIREELWRIVSNEPERANLSLNLKKVG